MDSQESAKTNTGKSYVPSPCFLPVIPSYITMVQYHQQEINIGRTHRTYTDFTHFICTHLCAV